MPNSHGGYKVMDIMKAFLLTWLLGGACSGGSGITKATVNNGSMTVETKNGPVEVKTEGTATVQTDGKTTSVNF